MKLHPLVGWLLGAVPLALPGSLPAAQPDPLNPAAAVPTQEYHSPLEGYRAQTDEPRQDWREANDQVGRIGGWRTYSMEGWEQPGESGGEMPAGGGHEHH